MNFKNLTIFLIAAFWSGSLWAQTDSNRPVVTGPIQGFSTPTPGSLKNKKSSKPRNRKKILRDRPLKTPTSVPTLGSTAIGGPTLTPTPIISPIPVIVPKPTPTYDGKLAQVSILSDPVRGNKAIFRVVTRGKAKALIRIYDRTYNKVAQLEGEGEDLFDLLWALKKIPEGIYHFQSQVILATGEVVTPSVQNFTIEKDAETTTGP